MINKSFVEKLRAEKPLDWKDVALLDQLLEDDSRSHAAFSALPEDEVSLAWRSKLNEKLLSSVKRRKKLALLPWIGGLTTAAAASIVIFSVGVHRQTEIPAAVKSGSLEASMVSIHAADASANSDPADVSDLLPGDSTPDM
jgi:hypothetical protein